VTTYPTLTETAVRLWGRLPTLWRTLLPALTAVILALLPATLIITSRFYTITRDNLQADHRATLAEIGGAFDRLINAQTFALVTLANSDAVRACATSDCTDVFRDELAALISNPDTYYVELGFINVGGVQTARASRGIGGMIQTSTGELFSADPDQLFNTQPGQAYIFSVSRDERLSPDDPYQQPVIRFAVPVTAGGERVGYVTSVIGVDDFFTLNFVPTENRTLYLLDTDQCLLATSNDTQRSELYKTWTRAADQVCRNDLPLQEWDVFVQESGSSIISTRVIHGALSTSGQTWTIVVEEPAALAYEQVNAMNTLVIGANAVTLSIVTALIFAGDRATRRLMSSDKLRLVTHARDSRFNPYIVGAPIDDPRNFYGRTDALAQVIGMGVMGGSDVLIVGEPGTGKTSLLRQIERRLRDRQQSDPTYWYLPVLFDVQGVPQVDFYRVLMGRILKEFPNHAGETDLLYDSHQDALYGIDAFKTDVIELIELPNNHGRQTRLVLCIDNVSAWYEPGSEYDSAFRITFRQMFTDIGTTLTLIATSTFKPIDRFAQELSIVQLTPLDRAESERMIRQPIADYYPISDEAVSRVLELSAALPLEIARLMRFTVQSMLEQDAPHISETNVNIATERVLAELEPAFRTIWNGGTRSGRTVPKLDESTRKELLEIAEKGGVVPPAFFDTHNITRAQLANVTYTDKRGVITLTPLFCRWLRQ
jgi:GTPase SAR1 family protein